MSDEPASPKAGWLERISALLLREPEDREQLITLARNSFSGSFLEPFEVMEHMDAIDAYAASAA